MSEYDVPIEEGVLRPLATTPARELEVWRNANLRASLARGLSQSAAGETCDLGSFAQYATNHGPAGMTPSDAADRLAIRQTLVDEWRDDSSVGTLVSALAETVAQIKAEAVDRERATWATKIETLADEWTRLAGKQTHPATRTLAEAADELRRLLGADDAKAKAKTR